MIGLFRDQTICGDHVRIVQVCVLNSRLSQDLTSVKHSKGICLVLNFSMNRFRAHTHLVYLLCVHSLHMSLFTLALICIMLLCVYVSCISFPVVVWKRPLMHLVCLFQRVDRRWRMPLASPLVSPIFVKRRFGSVAWPLNETAKLDQRLLELFCGLDRRSRPLNETAVHT